jgi:hypothetical protein
VRVAMCIGTAGTEGLRAAWLPTPNFQTPIHDRFVHPSLQPSQTVPVMHVLAPSRIRVQSCSVSQSSPIEERQPSCNVLNVTVGNTTPKNAKLNL